MANLTDNDKMDLLVALNDIENQLELDGPIQKTQIRQAIMTMRNELTREDWMGHLCGAQHIGAPETCIGPMCQCWDNNDNGCQYLTPSQKSRTAERVF